MKKIGIGVVTYNRIDYLKRCIDGIKKHTQSDYELIIADDGGTDGSVEWAASAGLRVVTGTNNGVCWNKNRALAAMLVLGCDPILLIEDDCVPICDGWEAGWREATILYDHLAFAHPKLLPWAISGSGTVEDPYINNKATAQCTSVSRKAIIDVGFLDTRFKGYGVGHAEWTTRMKKKGYGFKLATDADGRTVKANIYISGGLSADDAPTYKDPSNIERNEKLFAELKKEGVFRLPWNDDQERKNLANELSKAGFEGASALLLEWSKNYKIDKADNVAQNNPISAREYWNKRYVGGGTSGAGSRKHLAHYKTQFLNKIVKHYRVNTVVELGCGDGYQLRNAVYPSYTGVDISHEVVEKCKIQYEGNRRRKFLSFEDVDQLSPADMVLSQDVIYHILDDKDYFEHLKLIFALSRHIVVIYGNDIVYDYKAKHVRLRNFVADIQKAFIDWELISFERNPFYSEIGNDPDRTWSNFFVYRRKIFSPDVGSQNLYETAKITSQAAEGNLDTIDCLKKESDNNLYKISRSNSNIEKVLKACADASIIDVSGWCESTEERQKYIFYKKKTLPRVVVSLTTIKSRLEAVVQIVESLCNQSYPLNEIVINVSQDPYLLDEGITEADIPKSLNKLVKQGFVRVSFVDNIGPYRKLLPTLKQFWRTNTIIITADDDVILPTDWAKVLIGTHLDRGGIVAFRGRSIATFEGQFRPYREWQLLTENGSDRRAMPVLPTGKHGILYPAGAFNEMVFDPELISAAPAADDLYFRLMSAINATKSSIVDLSASMHLMHNIAFKSAEIDNEKSLFSTNKKDNDKQLAMLLVKLSEKGFDVGKITAAVNAT